MNTEHKKMIEELSALMEEQTLKELDYQYDNLHIRLVKKGADLPPPPPKKEEVILPDKSEEKVKEKRYITSPLVGIVYLAKETGLSPFVQVGDTLETGKTVCLIEAMKTFNPVKADLAGKVVAVLVENGQPVEYGQPLFEVE